MDLNKLIEETKSSLSPDQIDVEKGETEEEEKDQHVSFNLEDAIDADLQKGFTDVDPFLSEIADKVNLNNNRLSKAVEGLINLNIAQAEVIKGMESKINALNETVEKMANAPSARKAIITKGDAEENVAVERFEKGDDVVALAPNTSAPEATVGQWRDKVSRTLSKGIKAGELHDAFDVIRFQSIPVSSPMKGVLSTLSTEAEDFVLKAHPELSKL